MNSAINATTRALLLASVVTLASCAHVPTSAAPPSSPTTFQHAMSPSTPRVFALTPSGYVPDSVVTASDGSVWFSAMRVAQCRQSNGCRREEIGTATGEHLTESKLGPVSSSVFGVTNGSTSTLWLTDARKTAYVFGLQGALLVKIPLRPVGGALTPPFVGPDGRTWFQSGSGGVVGVDSTYHIATIAKCKGCQLEGGVTAPDGNAWFFQNPAIGGFVRVTEKGSISKFFAREHVVDSLTAGPNNALWGVLGKNIVEYSTVPQFLRSFEPSIDPSQSGLRPSAGAVYWSTYGAYSAGRNILYFVGMTWTGDYVEEHEVNIGKCDSNDRQFFVSAPTYGGDGHYYIGIGCSPLSAPYTTGGSGYIVRL